MNNGCRDCNFKRLWPMILISCSHFFYSGFEMSDIENLCRVGISIASAKNGMRVCGLQYLSDSLGLMGGSSGGHTTRVGKLLPHYLTTIQRWCESDNAVYDNENENDNNNIIKSQDETSATRFRGGRETAGKNDPYKAFIRTKLDKISMIFQNSKYISHQLGDSKVGNIVSKDIIGETCGQIMPSPTATDTATATTGSVDPGPVDAMLITQMNNLKNNFRLLAGPLGEEEEKDISVSGDSLTTLRKKVRARTDEEKNRMRRSPFNPLNFEKEEKIKAVISDYISDTESSPFTTGSALEEPGTRPGTGTSGKSRRNLPAVAISDMECYELRLHMKAVCGKSPITLISVPKLKELFSIGYSDTIVEKHVSVVIKNSRSDIGDNVNSKVISDSISSSENSSSASTDSLTQCVEQDPESVHSIPLPLQLSVPMVGVLPVDPLINISDNDDDDTDDNGDIDTDDDDEVALKSNSNSNSAGVTVPFDDTFNAAKSDLIRLSRTVRASRTIESSVESNNDKIEYTDIPIKEAKANIIETPLVTTETEAASETRNIEIVKPVPLKIPSKAKDPAAAHRLKVKRMLAELNSMDIVKDEDKIGGVKEVLVRSEGKETKETKETKGKDLAPKADAGDAALIERQTDVLARLLEQRIHDRWAQAALESVQPNPFNKTNLNK